MTPSTPYLSASGYSSFSSSSSMSSASSTQSVGAWGLAEAEGASRAEAVVAEAGLSEWRAKYERLLEAHRRLQKTNHTLEDKLLRIVDKFESDKNQMTRDLATQTQKLVQAKLTIQQVHDRNQDLQSDLTLALNLLQNRPSSYLAQRVDSLPTDMQVRVRSYIADKQAERHHPAQIEGKKISVPIMEDVQDLSQNAKVSAAILAKVLEERAKERKRERKFCIDVGTQTHGWHFPDKLYSSAHVAQATGPDAEAPDLRPRAHPPMSTTIKRWPGTEPNQSDEVIQILRSISLEDPGLGPTRRPGAGHDPRRPDPAHTMVSNILMASVIRTPPASVAGATALATPTRDTGLPTSQSLIDLDEDRYEPVVNLEQVRRSSTRTMTRSATYSAMQTDL